MHAAGLRPVLAFVWQPQEITSQVPGIARRNATTAIFDISTREPDDFGASLKAAGPADVKISIDHFMDPTSDVLEASGINAIWVEYHPALANYSTEAFLTRVRELELKCACVPIISDVNTLIHIIQSGWHPPTIAIKGNEASGFVSTETTGILYSSLKQILKQNGLDINLIIWGGIATPEAAAAFLCSGVTGIVFESLHWQTDMVPMDDSRRSRISNLRPEHTAVVGRELGAPCHFFNKGNSPSVKELEQYAGSLCSGDITDQDRLAFFQRVADVSIPALESDLGRNDLIPLGPEAAFAESFAERFGRSTEQALKGFIAEVARLCGEAPQKKGHFLDNPVAKKLNTTFPFIQGAMSWISDVPGFALSVADAGGLPTVALGLKNKEQLERDLGTLKKMMGNRSYAVNIITLVENPYRDQQFAWIEETSPPFVVIAAGEPSHAARLRKQGIETIYIAPDEGLVRMALEAGVRFVVLEGNEAGGHVGEHSTLTLAQVVLDYKRREPGLFKDRHIILAGGIFNRETAFLAAMLGADAIQMGTAYLATEEIVSSGALSPLYQRVILDSHPGTTTVSGESIGLRVRSLKTPKIEAICALERERVSNNGDEASFRHSLESISAGSLLMAARGIAGPEGKPLDRETCLKEGQFMSGASAGVISRTCTIAELHRELAQGDFEPALPELAHSSAPVVLRTAGPKTNGNRFAVTGMALVNSLGNSPQEIWNASLEMKSGITRIPLARWDHSLFYDPKPRTPGKTYCEVGAFRNVKISRKELGIPPQDFRTMSESTRLSMWLAQHAIGDSGILESQIPRERIGVLISQNSGELAATVMDICIQRELHDILGAVQNVINMTPEMEQAVADEIMSGRLIIDDTTLLGRLNCTAGGFICNQYGLTGPSYSVTAACATSLAALYSAIHMIKNNTIDVAVVGGGEELLDPAHYLEFSAIGALAGMSGAARPPHEYSRPFDATRDGMVMGEGGAMIIVERESVAKERGAHIYAYITGIGASNSDQGMVESLAETQEIAFRAAFKDAGSPPEQVDLVECHATSTAQGDVEEVKALKRLFPSDKRTILTSFKSQIGHTLGASGLNNLIRSIYAMNAGIYPATMNFRDPDPEMGIEDSGFVIPTQPSEWPQPPNLPRRAIVNAFGFGGGNYVVHLEESRTDSGVVMVPVSAVEQSMEKSVPVREKPSDMEGVCHMEAHISGRPYRLGILADDKTAARTKVASTAQITQGKTPSSKDLRIMARQGIFAAPSDETPPSLAFVFSGQGSQYVGMGKELYSSFQPIREWMDRIAGIADFDLLNTLFHSSEEHIRNTRWQQPALFTLEFSIARYLMSLGVMPLAMAGHSVGELTALCAAGVYSWEDGFRLVNKRAQCMDKAGSLTTDPGAMIAVDAPMDVLEKKIREYHKVCFTNFNSPRQVVLGGYTQEIQAILKDLKKEGHRATRLNVSMAFHSPVMSAIRDEMETFISGIEFHAPGIPVISNTTMKPFPNDPVEIKKIVVAHLENPVHWVQNVETLKSDYGIKLFLEVGPKNALCNFISDTFEQSQCIHTCMPDDEVNAFRAGEARLFALGHLEADSTPLHRIPSIQAGETLAKGIAPNNTAAAAIVVREINAFVFEAFGKSLKPQILKAIRQEVDPSFSEERLEKLFQSGLASAVPASVPKKRQPVISMPPVVESSSFNVTTPPSPVHHGQPEASAENDHLEQVIRIIMDATGYERDEIEPDMDIRLDLAIRSSRLPVIIDAAERKFGIAINLEDFIGVRTVKELAGRIADVMVHDGITLPAEPYTGGAPLAPQAETQTESPDDEPLPEREPLKRLIVNEVPLEKISGNRLNLEPGQKVAVMNFGHSSSLAAEIGEFFQQEMKARPLVIDISGQASGNDGYDLRTAEGSQKAARYLASFQSLAGLVLVMDGKPDLNLNHMQEVTALLTGCFRSLKSLVRSQAKEFCLLVQRNPAEDNLGSIAADGILGMFLAATQEYSSVLFRSVTLDSDANIKLAMDQALDTGISIVQMLFRGRDVFTFQATNHPTQATDEPDFSIEPEDVVVISGGGRGITSHLALALAPFKPRIVLLGRSELDPSVDYERLIRAKDNPEQAVRRLIKKQTPDLIDEKLESEVQRLTAGMELSKTLKHLSQQGLDAVYYSCDVTDSKKVAEVMGRVEEQYGRIDGIVHGAGIIRDSFMEFMSSEDFSKVMDVKLLGAWNLYQASQSRGLRFMVGLSSIVAVFGNPGQVNYCAASRSLAAFMKTLTAGDHPLPAKALMLPPIEGIGMADDPEIRELMKLRDMESAYIHVSELAQLFCRELLLGSAEQPWVIPARTLPRVKTLQLDLSESVSEAGNLINAGVAFKASDMPMVEAIEVLDLEKGVLEVERTFSPDYDLWINDHKPFKSLKHPLVSGIMAVETFMEAASLLYPHMKVLGVRKMEYQDILDCPPDQHRKARIVCRYLETSDGEVSCMLSLSSQDLSPSGRHLDTWSTNYKGQVIMGGHRKTLINRQDLTINADALDTSPVEHDEVRKWYEYGTALTGRYRVVEKLDGTGPGIVKGIMIYHNGDNDFADLNDVQYRYSPYLLEAIMHLATMYVFNRHDNETRVLIPGGIGEMRFLRRCRQKEHITLEVGLKSQNKEGLTWNAQAKGDDGSVIMQVFDLEMKWFSE